MYSANVIWTDLAFQTELNQIITPGTGLVSAHRCCFARILARMHINGDSLSLTEQEGLRENIFLHLKTLSS